MLLNQELRNQTPKRNNFASKPSWVALAAQITSLCSPSSCKGGCKVIWALCFQSWVPKKGSLLSKAGNFGSLKGFLKWIVRISVTLDINCTETQILRENTHENEKLCTKRITTKTKGFTLSDSQSPTFSSSREMSQHSVISHRRGKLSDLRRRKE